MTEARPEPALAPAPLVAEAVDATATPDGGLLVRVAGAWSEGSGPRPALSLLVGSGTSARRVPLLAAASAAATKAAGGGDVVRAIFSVPPEAAARAGEGLALDAGGQTVALPAPGAGAGEAGAPPAADDGTVVDRAVLAERRARRAEALEADLRARAEAAEAAAATLELELAALEAAPPPVLRPDPDRLAREAALAASTPVAPSAVPPPPGFDGALAELLVRERRQAAGRRQTAGGGAGVRPGRAPRPGSVAAALDRLDQERRAAPELRRALIRREREVATLREQIDRAAADLEARTHAERAARTAADALDRAEEGIATAQAAARSVRQQLIDERAEWQAAEEEFRGALERERTERRATEAALRAALQRERQRAETAERRLAEHELASGAPPAPAEISEGQLALGALGTEPAPGGRAGAEPAQGDKAAAVPPAPAAGHAAEAGPAEPVAGDEPAAPAPDWLPAGLMRLATEHPAAGARLAASLLPAAGLGAATRLDCDIRAGEAGWHALRAAGDGEAGAVEALPARRPRRETQFRLEAGPRELAELLTTGTARARVRGTLRRRRARGRLGPVPTDLAALADAGVLLDPPALFAALALGCDPEGTAGQAFAVETQVGDAPAFWVVADRGLEVEDSSPPDGAQAAIRCSHRAFQRLLAGAPPVAGDKPALSGDPVALATLADWTARARAALA